jgi:hypothetical protein
MPPQSDIFVVTTGRKRLGANDRVRPTATIVKPSGKAGDKRVEAPEVTPRPPLAPVASRRKIKPTPVKTVLTEAAANNKRKKAATTLLKAAPTPLSRKARQTYPRPDRPSDHRLRI